MKNMNEPRTLAIDIGGSGIKAALLDNHGNMIGDRQRVPTPPKPVAPGALVHAIDEADVQGFGAIKGQGVEMVLTLGTGAGTAIFRDGEIMPHLELAHHPVSGGKTYDEYIGNAARQKKGRKVWSKRVAKVIEILRVVVRFDHLYLGGGNAKHIAFPLPPDVTIVPNTEGLTGGIRLWREEPQPAVAVKPPPSEPDQASTTST